MLSKAAMQAYNRAPVPVAPVTPEGPNPFYHLNLPPDYPTLTAREQKAARLNGIMLQTVSPAHFVRAWNLMRTYYLRQLPDGVFYKDFIPSPPCHFDAVRDLATYQLNAWAFPRGSGKSTVLGKEVPLLLAYGRPHFDMLLILAKDSFVQKRFSLFMRMIEGNKYLLNDFGSLKPGRGPDVYNHNLIQLRNGVQLQGMAVEGKMLGERPDLILPDDPEHDKAMVANPNPDALLEAFERLLFGTLMPMLREGSCMGWIGTLLSARSFLYNVTHSTEVRYSFWNRRILAGLQEDGRSLWPAKWNEEALGKMRMMWGEEMFQTHMQNRPGTGKARTLHIHPEYCTYNVEKEDDAFGVTPLTSGARLVTTRPVKLSDTGDVQPEPVSRSYGETVREMHRILTVDFAFTTTKRSDFSCAMVLGFENSPLFTDTLWVLDMWLGKKTPADFINVVLGMAYKWQVRKIAAEAVTIQQQLVDQIASGLDAFEYSAGWKPNVIPIRYPANLKKAQRIAGLEWRFRKYRVKLPGHLRDVLPWRELFRQIEDFSEDMSALRYDDAVDSLAMHQFVGRPRSSTHRLPAGERIMSPVEAIKSGEILDPNGVPWISAISTSDINDEVLAGLKKAQVDDEEDTIWQYPGTM